jgi:FtsP/CotA-like multicopper oxidase with cupredoxin domain/Cu/Ag efflux protein CusF
MVIGRSSDRAAGLWSVLTIIGIFATSIALADDPPPASQVPLYDRYLSSQAYLRGGRSALGAFDAERNHIPGADDEAVSVVDRPDGSRDVTIQLEIIEVQQEVYPGKRILFWVFAPLGSAMSPVARLPSPTLRVEDGDHVKIVLYNTHYFPHTIHFHGVNVPFDMDGVPDISQQAVLPGRRFVYEFTAVNSGTYSYHCHVNPAIHPLMGLSGMFIIEPRRPDNHFARVIIGAGRVASIAKGTLESYQGEYSLVYQDVDERLNRIALAYTDAREVEMRMHRDYDSTQRKANIFLLNGFASPYSLADSPILVKPDQVIKLRILNVGGDAIYFHPHGHHPVLTDVDGDPLEPQQRYSRDTFEIGAAQRVDLALHTERGRYASGPGVWMVHDHKPSAETNAGIDGGAMTAIVYDGYMQSDGLPKTAASLAPMFQAEMNAGRMPTFDPKIFATDAASYQSNWPAAPPLGGAFAYPTRTAFQDELPRLDLIDLHRHHPVADSCAERPRLSQTVHVGAGSKFARPGEVFAFEPRTIRVGRCVAVTLIFDNTDDVRHEFMIPGLNPLFAMSVLGPGSTQATFVTPDRDVTMLFHCHVSTHERHGMLGLLVVGKGSALNPMQADGIEIIGGIARLSAAHTRQRAAGGTRMAMETAQRRVWHGTAAVVSVMARERRIVVDGDAIPGYMAAMTMAYTVSSPELLEGVRSSDRIEFTLDAISNTIIVLKRLSARR